MFVMVSMMTMMSMMTMVGMMAPKVSSKQSDKKNVRVKGKSDPKALKALQPLAAVKREQLMDGIAPETVTLNQTSNFLTTMKSKAKAGSLSPEQKETWDLYMALDRFDLAKKALICRWDKDKSCKWLTTYTTEKSASEKTKELETSGYCSRFVLAAKMCMDVTSDVFQKVLATFDSDDNWDLSKSDEKALSLLGEKRYFVKAMGSLTETTTEIMSKEIIQEHSTSSSSKTPTLADWTKPEEGQTQVEVKINPMFLELDAMLKVLKSCLGAINKLKFDMETQLEVMLARLRKKNAASVDYRPEQEEVYLVWQQQIKKILEGTAEAGGLEAFRKELSAWVSDISCLTMEDIIEDAVIGKAKMYQKVGETHVDGVKKMLKAMRNQSF